MATVRQDLETALKGAESVIRQGAHLNQQWLVEAQAALDRARREPEGCICDTCPVCAVSVRDCQCYQEGIEAQREPAGRGTP